MKMLCLVAMALTAAAASLHGDKIDVCSFPLETGPCRANYIKWGFDAVAKQCKQFTYGGCHGNENNFGTEAECSAKCKPEPEDTCSMPLETGPCRANYIKWGFDAVAKQCKQFTYGGCHGNENNFGTEEECSAKCKPTSSKPKPEDICSLPLKKGPCRARKQSWGFDAVAKRCKQFNYGGCGGNANRFKTEEECSAKCEPDLCSLPLVTGNCRANIKKWGFDSVAKKCKKFTYGGCGGNKNKFSTKQECLSKCKPSKPKPKPNDSNKDDCSLPLVTGNCRAHIPSWGYDAVAKKCKTFTYGGCRGNKNRFNTKQECLAACKPKRQRKIRA